MTCSLSVRYAMPPSKVETFRNMRAQGEQAIALEANAVMRWGEDVLNLTNATRRGPVISFLYSFQHGNRFNRPLRHGSVWWSI